jgi:hypothetical protein
VFSEGSRVTRADEQGLSRIPVPATSEAVGLQNTLPGLKEAREILLDTCISVGITMYDNILSCIFKRWSSLGHVEKLSQSHGNRQGI